MQYYKIAGLTVAMDSFGRSVTQAQPYSIPACETPDITIRTGGGEILHKQHPNLSLEDCEYLATGSSFYRQLLNFDGMLLHASAVVMDGKAYLFSAPCGTGKSTHTALWQKVFGKDRVQILNDDKPALRLIDGTFFACGTPWSGKHDISINGIFPLAGICVLRRGEVNTIARIAPGDAIFSIADQTFRPGNAALMDKMLTLLDQLLNQVPVWQLECNMEPEAAQVAHDAMSAV